MENNAPFALFNEVMKERGYEENTVFSPYGVQQALGLLGTYTSDAETQEEFLKDAMPMGEKLKDTKSGSLLLYLDKEGQIEVNPELARITRSQTAADGIKQGFQMETLGDVMDPSPAAEGLNLFVSTYYKSRWETAFPKGETKPRDFWLAGGQRIQVPTMRMEEGCARGEIAWDYEHAVLPCKNGSRVHFVKPKGEAADVQRRLPKIIMSWRDQPANFEMPKLTAENTSDLRFLAQRYPKLAGRFTLDKICSEYPVELGKAYQIADMKMDEEGAVARAFTVFAMPLCCSMSLPKPRPLEIRMDHPYFIVIEDANEKGQGRIVFTAWIARP